MKTTTKDGKTTRTLYESERNKINGVIDILTGGLEYTTLIEKSKVAIAALKDWLKEFPEQTAATEVKAGK